MPFPIAGQNSGDVNRAVMQPPNNTAVALGADLLGVNATLQFQVNPEGNHGCTIQLSRSYAGKWNVAVQLTNNETAYPSLEVLKDAKGNPVLDSNNQPVLKLDEQGLPIVHFRQGATFSTSLTATAGQDIGERTNKKKTTTDTTTFNPGKVADTFELNANGSLGKKVGTTTLSDPTANPTTRTTQTAKTTKRVGGGALSLDAGWVAGSALAGDLPGISGGYSVTAGPTIGMAGSNLAGNVHARATGTVSGQIGNRGSVNGELGGQVALHTDGKVKVTPIVSVSGMVRTGNIDKYQVVKDD